MNAVNKDSILRELFQLVALRAAGDRGACKLLVQGEVYHVCPVCVYKGMPIEDELELPEGAPAQYHEKLTTLQLTDAAKVKPEILLDRESLKLTVDNSLELQEGSSDIAMVTCAKPPLGVPGIMLLEHTEGMSKYLSTIPYEANKLLASLPIKLVALPVELEKVLSKHEIVLQDLKAEVMRTKLTGHPVLMLSSETSLMYVTLMGGVDENDLATIVDPSTSLEYAGDGWDDATNTYKRIIRKKGQRMKGLTNPITGAKKVTPLAMPAKAKEAEAAEEVKVEESAPAPKPTEAKPVAPKLGTTPEPKPAPEPKPEPEPAPEPEPKKAPAKRTRKKREAVELGFDFTEVHEYLASTLQEFEQDKMEEAMDEVRQLRDLQIAAARRMSNITTEMVKASKASVEKLDALKSMLA